MMDGEDSVYQHSLPEPERRKPFKESAVGKGNQRIRIAIWATAGLLIVVVIVAFSLAIANSTNTFVGGDSERDSSPAANGAGMPTDDEGGFDFDYGGTGGVDEARDSFSYDDFSYSSSDDGGSYNVDHISTRESTYAPTYEPTNEVRELQKVHVKEPTFIVSLRTQ